MYFSFGIETILKNCLVLGSVFTEQEKVKTLNDLKLGYRKFLANRQSDVFMSNDLKTTFVKNIQWTQNLSRFYKITSRLDDREQNTHIQSPCSDFLKKVEIVEKKFNDFTLRFPELGEVFNTVIHSVFCSPSTTAGGGSTSGAIGVIWCGARENWDEQDFFEFFVHELTHNLLFIDEHRHLHYKNYQYLSESSYFAWSAILGMNRPLDKVLHSLVVATEILLFREKCIGHPRTPKLHPRTPMLLKKTRASIHSIIQFEKTLNCLTERGQKILFMCNEIVSELEKKQFEDFENKENKYENYRSIPVEA